MFEELTPTPIMMNIPIGHYSRQERRHQAFVIRNNVNNLYVERDGKIYRDVPLSEATGFKWRSIEFVIAEMLQLNPTLDLKPMMAYRDSKTRKICVR